MNQSELSSLQFMSESIKKHTKKVLIKPKRKYKKKINLTTQSIENLIKQTGNWSFFPERQSWKFVLDLEE